MRRPITSKAEWIANVLAENKIDKGAFEYGLIKDKLNVIFEGASRQIRLRDLYTTQSQFTQMTLQYIVTTLFYGIAGLFLKLDPDDKSSYYLEGGLLVVLCNMMAALVMRKSIKAFWKEGDIISSGLLRDIELELKQSNSGENRSSKMLGAADIIIARLPSAIGEHKQTAVVGLTTGALTASTRALTAVSPSVYVTPLFGILTGIVGPNAFFRLAYQRQYVRDAKASDPATVFSKS